MHYTQNTEKSEKIQTYIPAYCHNFIKYIAAHREWSVSYTAKKLLMFAVKEAQSRKIKL